MFTSYTCTLSFFFRHNSGSFNMALFNVDVTTVLQLGEDADGRLSVTAVQCLAKVGSVDVKLNGQFRCRQLVDDGEAQGERDGGVGQMLMCLLYFCAQKLALSVGSPASPGGHQGRNRGQGEYFRPRHCAGSDASCANVY